MKSLAKSDLWDRIHEYYNNVGPEAWQEEVVPLQISSNKLIARIYADLIISHIKDYLAENTISGEPFHIVELGAGHGKLSFYLVKYLLEALDTFQLPENSIKYVLSDISTKNVESWQSHPALNQFVEKSILDFAKFNALDDKSIDLLESGVSIKPGSLSTPVFIICNYLFDSLAHDAFQVINGQLHETLISIDSKASGEEFFSKAAYKFTQKAISTNYYQEPILNKILKDYSELDNSSFLLPIGGLSAVQAISKLTSKNVCLLLADKGYTSIEEFKGLENPDIGFHGSVSLMVNFDAVAKYFKYQNGQALLMPNQSAEFQIACFCSEVNHKLNNFNWSFKRNLHAFTPEDLIHLSYPEESREEKLSLEEYLAIANLSDWDPNVFCEICDDILEIIEANEDLTVDQHNALIHGAKKVWEFAYKLEKAQDIPFSLGNLYYALDEYEIAIEFFYHSINWFGENAENLYNCALCYSMLEDHKKTMYFAEKCLTVNPSYAAAKQLIKEQQTCTA